MTGRCEAQTDTIDLERRSIRHFLKRLARLVAIASAHDRQRLRRAQHMDMTRTRMVAMTVRDDRTFDFAQRVDVEAPGFDEQPFRSYANPIFGFRNGVHAEPIWERIKTSASSAPVE